MNQIKKKKNPTILHHIVLIKSNPRKGELNEWFPRQNGVAIYLKSCHLLKMFLCACLCACLCVGVPVPLRCCLCAHAANVSMCERDGPCLTLQHWHNCCTLIFRLYKQRVMSVIYSLVHASNYGASSLKSIGHPVLFCPVSGKRIFHLMVNLESVRGALCVGEIGTDMAAHS